MTTKRFDTARVLTVYTGVCMKTGVGMAQDVFDHLYPGIMTLGCAKKQPEAAQALAIQHPQLAAIRPIDKTEGDYLRFLNDARAIFGDTMAVSGPLPDAPDGLSFEMESIAKTAPDMQVIVVERGRKKPNT